MIQSRSAPRWLTFATAAYVLCFAVAAGYVGYLAYETRNTTPFERDSEQYNGWQYAEMNQFKGAGQCEDMDGGWAALGIETSAEFLAGCREWLSR